MKKILLSIICFLACIFSVSAQTLYGTSPLGGIEKAGALDKFVTTTNNLTVAKSFESFGSLKIGGVTVSYANLVQANNGKLYGMLNEGGSHGYGIIFSFDPVTAAYTKVKDFDNTDGANPTGSLIQANDGKLYGMTPSGGANNAGVIFSFDILTSTYSKLKDLGLADGGGPRGSLVQAGDQKLYGMTYAGGSLGFGVIFSFDISSSTYTNLKDFDRPNGAYPTGNLIQANNGKLYGMTSEGGNGIDLGVIFSFDPLSSVYQKLKDFVETEGVNPIGSLVQASDGKLYGMTSISFKGGGPLGQGPGVLFSLELSNSLYTKLADICCHPFGSLIQGTDGKLYGATTGFSVIQVPGTIFSYDLSTFTVTKLKDFDGTDGASPVGGLIQASDGKFYGMTTNAGAGVIYSFVPPSSYTKLTAFDNTAGTHPNGSLVQATDGKLYGMTPEGGNSGVGVIYSFDDATSTYTRLIDLDSANGATPFGSLTQAKDGKLYGMTSKGGSNNLGVIFSFAPSTSTYTKLIDFGVSLNGSNPHGSLILASDGKLYGMTTFGGGGAAGVIFSFDPSTSTFTKLYEFGFEGANPYGNLIEVNGKLYGLTSIGGSPGLGVIFSVDPSGSNYTVLKELDNTTGSRPFGSLVQATDGKLYGMTTQGGSNGHGVIFSYDLSNGTYTKWRDNGGPGSFLQASNGNLYAIGTSGDDQGMTEIFSFNPLSSLYTKLKDFDGAIGNASALIELRECTTNSTWYEDADGDGFGNPNSSVKACTQPEHYVADNTDCDDNNKAVHLPVAWYQDKDGDGYGNPAISVTACSKPSGYVTDKTDCDDNNSAIHASVTWYRDEDGDGYGNPSISIKACTKPAGYVANNNDCNDKNRASHAPVTYYRDADRDGYGDPSSPLSVCKSTPPAGYVRNAYDCNDHKRAAQFWNERVLMCHNGISGCVYAKEIFLRLCQGWTLGLCPPNCNNNISRTIPGQIDIADIYGKKEPVPQQYKLSNFPNPFARTSTIKYELPLDSKVSIKVYDVLGRTVATLVNEYKKAGVYTVDFNGGNVSSGSLYYRIIATSKGRQFDQTNKMIQLR
ncbi:MAG: choice-of-anchor tandem repeat GloVer-containing protein [Ferruginibacter sp.]